VEKKEKIWNEAREATKNPNKLRRIVAMAREKLKNLDADAITNSDFIFKMNTIIKMLKAYIGGNRQAFSTRTILLITFAILYFIIPTDALPDFIPALGFTDDASLFYFIYKQIDADVEKFLQSEVGS